MNHQKLNPKHDKKYGNPLIREAAIKSGSLDQYIIFVRARRRVHLKNVITYISIVAVVLSIISAIFLGNPGFLFSAITWLTVLVQNELEAKFERIWSVLALMRITNRIGFTVKITKDYKPEESKK